MEGKHHKLTFTPNRKGTKRNIEPSAKHKLMLQVRLCVCVCVCGCVHVHVCACVCVSVGYYPPHPFFLVPCSKSLTILHSTLSPTKRSTWCGRIAIICRRMEELVTACLGEYPSCHDVIIPPNAGIPNPWYNPFCKGHCLMSLNARCPYSLNAF